MNKILVPHDFSDCAANALDYACQLAIHTEAAIILFHAYHPPSVDPNMPPNMADIMITEKGEDVKARLQKVKEALPAKYLSKIPFELSYLMGFATPSIVDFSIEQEADLILMGTTGASGFNKVIGSITSGVINKSEIPVLAIPKDAPFRPISKIVYASNFKPEDYKCIEQLTAFANYFDAHVTCLHISDEDDGHELQTEELQEYFWQEMARQKLDIQMMREDDFEKAINKYIRENDVDLLAMLTQKRNFFQRIFDKSNTRRMAMHAEIPLLAFHK